LASKAEFLLKY